MPLAHGAAEPIPDPLADELFLDLTSWRAAPRTTQHDQSTRTRSDVIAAQSSQEAL